MKQRSPRRKAHTAGQSDDQRVPEVTSDVRLSDPMSLMTAMHGVSLYETPDTELQPADSPREDIAPEKHLDSADVQSVKLYLVEEQQIYREAYRSIFQPHPSISLLADSNDTSNEALLDAANQRPNVILLGVKTIGPATVEKMDLVRQASPDIGIVLLFAYHDVNGIKALREFARSLSAGCAYLPKHTIDTAEQLSQVVHSVAEGHVIVDPAVLEEMISNKDPQNGLLKDLTPKAREVLRWIAHGYRNDSIAEMMGRDVKTVERHINNIYSTLQETEDFADSSKHPRVQAALLYLKDLGSLTAVEPGRVQ